MDKSGDDRRYQVVVVGAGPVGLSLALGLARQGAGVLVLEKNAATSDHSRAPAIWPGTQEVLKELGVIDTFLEEGIILPRLEVWDVDRQSPLFAAPLYELADRTPYPHLLILPQSLTEKILLDALQQETAGKVRFSCEVTDLTQDETGVQVEFRSAGGLSRVEADYIAGCDGAHSIVREKINAAYEGITYKQRAALADVMLGHGDELPFPRITTKPRLAVGIRMQGNTWRMILPFADNDGISLDRRVEHAARALFGDRVNQNIWQSEFSLHNRVSTSFAKARVVLAGDAAHLNSPVGGQGMNAGIKDASLLTRVIINALDHGQDDPFTKFSGERRQQILEGVNRFTDLLTRIMLGGRGKRLKTVFRLADTAIRIPFLRARLLKRLAMLD